MRSFEFRELTKDEQFDPSTIAPNVPFTQARFYSRWQEQLGRKVRRFVISVGGETVAFCQLVEYPLLRGKTYLYAPYGPVTKDISADFFSFLKKELLRVAGEHNAVFIRLDVTPPVKNEILAEWFTPAPLYTYHSAYFQPRVEWFLGLQKSEEELLRDMHEKARYSIGLARRKGITVEIVTEKFEQYFEIFYELMATTATRNGFNLHSKTYYGHIFGALADSKDAYLSVARHGEKVLAIDLVIVFSGIANYVFGGSNNIERNRMPTYLAQWEAIKQAKRLGCDFYSFGGIATEGSAYKGWEGLTAFKKKFGGAEVKHSDFFDIVAEPLWYHVYNLRKRLKQLMHAFK